MAWAACVLLYGLDLALAIEPFPSLANLHCFPDHKQTQAALAINRKSQEYIEELLALNPLSRATEDRLTARLAELRRRYDIWDALDWCYTPWGDRQLHLANLHDLLGRDAFVRGEMPCPIP